MALEFINKLLNMQPTTLLILAVAGVVFVLPMFPKVNAKLKSLVSGIVARVTNRSPATVAASDETIEHALDLVEDLTLMKRIADAKLVLDLIGGIQKSEPAPVAPSQEPTV